MRERVKIAEFKGHRWVEDILYFEGPLLSLLKASASQDFFYYWCGTFNKQNRWLALEVSRDQIEQYRNQDLSLLDILNSLGYGYVVFIDATQKIKSSWKYSVDDLPEVCVPPEESYFDPDLSEAGSESLLEKSGNYGLNVDGDWFLDDLVKIPRTFQQLYAFCYTLKNLQKQSVWANALHIFRKYPWRGGYSRVNFYQDLRRVIPSMHEAKIKKLQMASAGEFRFELLTSAAEDVRATVDAATNNALALDRLEKEAMTIFRAHKLSRIKSNHPELRLSKGVLALLRKKVGEIAEALGLGEYVEEIRTLAGNDLVAIKILLSFHRRVSRFTKFQDGNLIDFKPH